MTSTEKTKRIPPNAGKGRTKGVPNKLPADLKAMVFGALNAGGGQKWLELQRDENPVAFMTLLGKFVPKDLNVQSDATINIILNKPNENY